MHRKATLLGLGPEPSFLQHKVKGGPARPEAMWRRSLCCCFPSLTS